MFQNSKLLVAFHWLRLDESTPESFVLDISERSTKITMDPRPGTKDTDLGTSRLSDTTSDLSWVLRDNRGRRFRSSLSNLKTRSSLGPERSYLYLLFPKEAPGVSPSLLNPSLPSVVVPSPTFTLTDPPDPSEVIVTSPVACCLSRRPGPLRGHFYRLWTRSLPCVGRDRGRPKGVSVPSVPVPLHRGCYSRRGSWPVLKLSPWANPDVTVDSFLILSLSPPLSV